MEEKEIPTMLGGEGPQWLVITGPRYQVSGTQSFDRDSLREDYLPKESEEEKNPLKAIRMKKGLVPSEVPKRYKVEKEVVKELEENGNRISFLDWLRLYSLYEDTLSVSYIKEGETEEEKNYITLFNVLLRESASIYDAAMKTREHYVKESRRLNQTKSQRKRRMREKNTPTYLT